MNFKEATDLLMETGFTADEIGEGLALAAQTVRAMRLDPSSDSHRAPAADWRQELAKLARRRGQKLEGFSKKLLTDEESRRKG